MSDVKPSQRACWRPRFSLRTLLIFVLLIGSGATLWRNWGPFAPATTFEESRAIVNAEFSPDDSRILTCVAELKAGNEGDLGPFGGKSTTRFFYPVCIYDAKSAQRLHTLTMTADPFDPFGPSNRPRFSAYFANSKDYVYLSMMTTEGPDKSELYHIGLGRIEGTSNCGYPNERLRALSPNANYALLESGPNHRLVRLVKLPGRECIYQYENIDAEVFSSDERLLMTIDETTAQVVNAADGTIVCQFELDNDGDAFATDITVSPTEPIVCISVFKEEGTVTQLYEMHTGQKIAEYPGAPASQPFSPDGKRLITVSKTGIPAPGVFGGGTLPDKSKRTHVWTLGTDLPPVEFVANAFSFSPTGDEVRAWPKGLWDSRTGLWVRDDQGDAYGSPNGVLAINYSSPDPILFARTGAPAFYFSKTRWPKQVPAKKLNVVFAHRSNSFLTYDRSREDAEESSDPASRRVTIWRQTRPFEWYGVAWLAEFWAVVVLGVGLVWSLWQDVKCERNRRQMHNVQI